MLTFLNTYGTYAKNILRLTCFLSFEGLHEFYKFHNFSS